MIDSINIEYAGAYAGWRAVVTFHSGGTHTIYRDSLAVILEYLRTYVA